jgi:hypothetical protein
MIFRFLVLLFLATPLVALPKPDRAGLAYSKQTTPR